MEDAYNNWTNLCRKWREQLANLESCINQIIIDTYDLSDALSASVSEDEVSIYHPDCEEDIKRLISYALGCMMGRYSLDKPGLIYAHSSNKGFDSNQYQTFPADDDGIIPITEADWFADDASNRLAKFISVAWPQDLLEENLMFIADSLGPNRNEQPRDIIRRYLATGFDSIFCPCTSAAQFTGSFPAANNEPSSVSSTFIAITKVLSPGCAPSM